MNPRDFYEEMGTVTLTDPTQRRAAEDGVRRIAYDKNLPLVLVWDSPEAETGKVIGFDSPYVAPPLSTDPEIQQLRRLFVQQTINAAQEARR